MTLAVNAADTLHHIPATMLAEMVHELLAYLPLLCLPHGIRIHLVVSCFYQWLYGGIW